MTIEKVKVYLSPLGSDLADGSKNSPVKTIAKAAELVRAQRQDMQTPAEIIAADGIYERQTAVFGKEDSNLTVCAAEGAAPCFVGGYVIDPKTLGPVKDEAIRRRLPANVADSVLVIDCSGFEEELHRAHTDGKDSVLFVNGKHFICSRFPKKNKNFSWRCGEYARTTDLVHLGPNCREDDFRVYYGDDVNERTKNWDPASLSQMYIYGHFFFDWHTDSYLVDSFDFESKSLLVKGGTKLYRSNGGGGKFYFANVLEELSDPGEAYFDYANKKVYFIPEEPVTDDTEIIISTKQDPTLTFENCRDITLRNISMGFSCDENVEFKYCENVLIEGGTYAHDSTNCITVSRCTECTIRDLHVYDNGCGGISVLYCGDRAALTEAHILVENCEFHDVDTISKCYVGAVTCHESCGVTIRGNTFYNSAHMLLGIGLNNEIIIENNEFYNACMDSDDCGCIYWGRNPVFLGTAIRNNYFHDIGNDWADFGVHTIYVDDFATGPEIYNNIFDNCSIFSPEKDGILDGSFDIFSTYGTCVSVHNNIFILHGNQKPMNNLNSYAFPHFISHVNDCPVVETDERTDWHKFLTDSPFYSDVWRRKYSGSQWEIMWQVADEKHYNMYQDILNSVDQNDREAYLAARHKVRYLIYEELWDHVGTDGKLYDGSLQDYLKDQYATVLRTYTKIAHDTKQPREPMMLLIEDLLYDDKIHIRNSNRFENNLTVGERTKFLNPDRSVRGHGCIGAENNYNPETDLLPNGESMFVEPGKNFELTDAGLAEVRKHIPNFHKIETADIGCKKKFH